MVLDPTRFAHSAGGNNHLFPVVKIDRTGFVRRSRHLQPLKRYGIYSLMYQLPHLFVKTGLAAFPENLCRLNCQRAVYVYGKLPMALNQPAFLNIPDKIKNLLRPPTANEGMITLPPRSNVFCSTFASSVA